MTLSFSKYEGLGNDFLVVDDRTGDLELAAKHAVSLCDRHRGVGGDGVLLVGTAPGRLSMRVINADGSRPEMCGNGVRCVALHLVRIGAAVGASFDVDTEAGVHRCVVQNLSGDRSQGDVQVTMRVPSLEPASLPVVADAPVIDQELDAGEARVRVTCVSMGNPHAVTFDEVGEQRKVLGPLLEKHPRFPRAANIGFARVVAPQVLDLAVWERGVGFTEACGTGACAAAVAAVTTKRAKGSEPIEVRLPGGPLRIVVGQEGERLLMTGPARHVFDGSVQLTPV